MATIFSNQSVIHYEKRHGIQRERKTSKPKGGLIDERLLNKNQKGSGAIQQTRFNKSNFSDTRERTDNLSKQMKNFSNALDELEDGLDEASEHIEHWQGIFTYSAGKVYVTETSEYYADRAREERRRRNKMDSNRKASAVSTRSRVRSSRSTTYTFSSGSDSDDDDTVHARKTFKKVKSKSSNISSNHKKELTLPRVQSSVTFQHQPKQRPHTSRTVQLDKIETLNKRLTRSTASSANARINTTDGADIRGYNKVKCPALGYTMTGTMVRSIDKLQPHRLRGTQKIPVKNADSVFERLSNVRPDQVPDSNRTICPRVRAIAGPLNSYAWAGTDRDRTGSQFSQYVKSNMHR